MTIKNNIIIRAYCFYILIIMIGVLILIKIAVVQINIVSSPPDNIKYVEISSIPGSIYSTDGKILATTIASYELRMDMNIKHIDDTKYDKIIDDISQALSIGLASNTKKYYKNKLQIARKYKNRYFLLESNIGLEQLRKLKTLAIFKASSNKTGLIIVKKLKRSYPFNDMALRTIGYTTSNQGVGIEGAYSKYLLSENVKIPITRGLGGIMVPLDTEYLGVVQGSDVVLTVDTKLQVILQKALLNALVYSDAQSGTAILMEVSTGKIKGISNFLKNSDNTYSESFNLAIGSSIEPGSTFKLASIMAGLEDKKFSINTTVDVEDGTTKFYNRTLKDSSKPVSNKITIKDAFKYSSNVGVAKTIWQHYKNNPQQFVDRLKQFHLDKKLGLDIVGEGAPVIKTPASHTWSKITLPWMSIGYEVLQTPIGILSLYNTIANNGQLVKPQFVEQIIDGRDTIKKFKTITVDKKICNNETLMQAKILLQEAGSLYAKKLGKDLEYDIAGKTGTAQIADNNKGYKLKGEKIKYRASFCGYFPAEKPKYSLIVMINSPSKSYYGAQVAFPVFKEVVNSIYLINAKDFKDISQININDTKLAK